MTKRHVAEGVKQDTPHLISGVSELPVESTESTEFQVEYNQEEGIASFSLEDGTAIVMKSPKTRQFLLLDSFMKSVDSDYKTESFVAVKLASLCITKFGDRDKVTFDELLDNLEITDLERVAAAIMCFRDKLEAVGRKPLL